MAEYISFQPSDYYSTKLYTGTGAELGVTGVGFEPNIIWIKERDNVSEQFLAAKTMGIEFYVNPSSTGYGQLAQTVKAFDSDGFTLGDDATMVNDSGEPYVSWNIGSGGTTTGLDFSAGDWGGAGGTIYSYYVDTARGIGMYQYHGLGGGGSLPKNFIHLLGRIPRWVMIKGGDAGANFWWPIKWSFDTVGGNTYQKLNENIATADDSGIFGGVRPDVDKIYMGGADSVGDTGERYQLYAFCDVPGFSKGGNYKGNGQTNGAFIWTGFRPAFIIIKSRTTTENWYIYDDKRGYNGAMISIEADNTNAEGTAADSIDLLSNGFKLRSSGNELNQSATQFFYLAFAEFPIVSSNDIPGVAR